MIDVLGQALAPILDPLFIPLLIVGLLAGLMIGALPGLGSLAGLSILLPFTVGMDVSMAIPMLVGLAAVTGTSDAIPAVFFGVPGTAAGQATIMDGYPMARKGEAGRALGAAFSSSLMGGVFGVMVLVVMLPVLRPVVLAFGAPEFFMLSMVGIVMIGSLTGGSPIKGIIAGGMGLLIGQIGLGLGESFPRWTMGTLYLWDGVSVLLLALGLFALPEIVDLSVRGKSISDVALMNLGGKWTGLRDTIRNWWLVIRSSAIGAFIGFLPGMGASTAQWLVYAHAVQTCKNPENFGKGDVRGVIAAEACNNATMAAAFIPTIVFGIPGNPPMAVMLGAFLMAGLIPGPSMLTTNLDKTILIIWSLALANVIAAILAFSVADRLAKIALAPAHRVLAIVVPLILIGAVQAQKSWGDVVVLVCLGILGWFMKRFNWPRPPMILGLVLSPLIEKYFFISVSAYGADWLYRPLVLLIGFLTVVVVTIGLRARPKKPASEEGR